MSVRHRGKIAAADTVFVNLATGTTYTVNSVTATTVVLSGFAGTLVLTNGDRLIPSNNLPTLYSDDFGGATTANPLTTNANGRANCWLEFGAYDTTISIGGTAVLNLTSQVASTENPGQIRYADDYAVGSSTGGIQEALNDLPANGGTVVLGTGTYSITAQVIVPDRSRIVGQGKRSTVIQAHTSFAVSTPVVRLGPGGSGRLFDMRLEHLQVDCNDIAGSTGVYSTETNEGSGLLNVNINKYRSVGVDILTSGGGNAGCFSMRDCEVYGSTSGSTSGVRLNTLDVGFSFVSGTINTNNAAALGTDAFDLTSCHVFIADAHIEKHTDGIDFKSGSSGTACNIFGLSNVTNLVNISAGSGVSLFNIAPNAGTNAIVDAVTSRTLTTSSIIGYYLMGSDGGGAAKAVLTSSNIAAGYNQLAGQLVYRAFQTLTVDSTTPSVGTGNWFKVTNTVPTSITTLTDGHNGQVVILEFTNNNTTLVNGTFILAASANYNPAAESVIQLIYDGSSWFEVSRSVN